MCHIIHPANTNPHLGKEVKDGSDTMQGHNLSYENMMAEVPLAHIYRIRNSHLYSI